MSDFTDQEFDPRRRRLCPDGSCVGVIGDDGKCRECGAVDAGWTAENNAAPSDADKPTEIEAAAPAGDVDHSGFDSSRRLCSDGTCLGLLGPDGRCNECGQLGEPESIA